MQARHASGSKSQKGATQAVYNIMKQSTNPKTVLRHCALSCCDKTEETPKAFKVCAHTGKLCALAWWNYMVLRPVLRLVFFVPSLGWFMGLSVWVIVVRQMQASRVLLSLLSNGCMVCHPHPSSRLLRPVLCPIRCASHALRPVFTKHLRICV